MSPDAINRLSEQDCYAFFERCCASATWCKGMCRGRPYQDEYAVEQQSQRLWDTLTTEDWMEAFAAHPMIGDLSSLKAKYANTQTLAGAEQAGTAVADEDTLNALSSLNKAYHSRHGFIFIICATGLSAQQMLTALQARIDNSTEQERRTAAREQQKITHLRLAGAMRQNGEPHA